MLLGRIVFHHQDQLAFAAASHDVNPIHVDPIAARRLLSGGQVVHGMHTLMHAIDLWNCGAYRGRVSVSCTFQSPIGVGDEVEFTQVDEADGRTRIRASVQGIVCTDVVIRRLSPADPTEVSKVDRSLPRRESLTLDVPLDEEPARQVGVLTSLELLPPEDLVRRFPQAAGVLAASGLASLAGLSYFVGMICPGLHSVFSSLKFESCGTVTDRLTVHPRSFDARFQLFIAAFDGPLIGELRAFRRPPPQRQMNARAIAERLDPHEFQGRRAIVIGGSRGLGEIVAKTLCGGGANVTVTYAAGEYDARQVAADINANGRGYCDVAHLDLAHEFSPSDALARSAFDEVYYFATPRIFTRRSELFERGTFDRFADFYVDRFDALCRWLETAAGVEPIRVYLPSTVFIEERPKGMVEYAMAKAAAELLADEYNLRSRRVRIVHTRLPRMATDQTSAIVKVSVAPSEEIILDVVRRLAPG